MSGRRFVFEASLILEHQHTDIITSVGQDDTGEKAYIGLANGSLEEHTLQPTATGGVAASLTMRKSIGKKPSAILAIHPLLQINCIVIHTADGQLHIAEADTLECNQPPFRNVLAVCATMPAVGPPLLGIAFHTGKRTVRISCCELPVVPLASPTTSPTKSVLRQLWEVQLNDVLPAVDTSSSAGPSTVVAGIQSMAWAGRSIVVAVDNKYILAAPRSIQPPAAQASPKRRTSSGGMTVAPMAVLAGWQELLAIEHPPQLIPTEPQQQQQAGAATKLIVQSVPWADVAVLLVGDTGVVIGPNGEPIGNPLRFDTLPPVRALAAGSGCILAICEDGIHVFDPLADYTEVQYLSFGMGIRPSASQTIHTASGHDGNARSVVVAGRHLVWSCVPVPPEDQIKELLARREYEMALVLADKEERMWAEQAYAEAALLLLHDCRFEEATAALEHCSPATFQPIELLPLFPSHTVPSLANTTNTDINEENSHWGLHHPLEALGTIIDTHIQRELTRQLQDITTVGSSDANGNGAKINGNLRDKPASSSLQSKQDLLVLARTCLLQYLFRARELPDVQGLNIVDTLLLHILLDQGAIDEATAFASVPNKIDVACVEQRLLNNEADQQALATLWASAGKGAQALEIWRKILKSSSSSNNKMRRDEAIAAAVDLLCDESVCSEQDVVQALPWLLECSSSVALTVVQQRQPPVKAVLDTVQPGSNARLCYLEWLVSNSHINNDGIHTELALALATAALEAPQGEEADLADYEQRLVKHLQTSTLWDEALLLEKLQGTTLHRPLVSVYNKANNHIAALRILALTLRDLPAAEEYVVQHLPPAEYRLLLHIILHPQQAEAAPVNADTAPLPVAVKDKGDQQQSSLPWEDACHVVATLGAHLDPLELVKELPPDMPLSVAERVISPLVKDRVHRQRHAMLVMNLNRSRLTAVRAKKGEAEVSQHLTVDEDKACPVCHIRLGGKVFVMLPVDGDGVDGNGGSAQAMCLNCWKKQQRQTIA